MEMEISGECPLSIVDVSAIRTRRAFVISVMRSCLLFYHDGILNEILGEFCWE